MALTGALRAIKALGAILAAATLAACGGGGGGGGNSIEGNGSLRVAMTDAPSCGYDNVFVTVEKVRVHTSSASGDADAGWREIVLSPARQIDLLNLSNGVLEELGTTSLPAGKYQQVRLVLASNTGSTPLANAVKPTGGVLQALNTPSAQQSGLKVQANIDVRVGETADIVLDFDACKSVVLAGNSGRYNLKPVLSVLPRSAGSVSGYVTTTLSLSSTIVSVQQNGAVVRSTTPDADGRFMLPYLQLGTYNVVVASEGRATLVVTGVPVNSTSATTTITTSTSALVPPTSTMSVVSGTTTVAGTTTLATDAIVTASQALTGGPTIVYAGVPVDADLATYSLRLPIAAPQKSAYAASGLVFTADNAVAGDYTLRATAPGRTAVQQAVDVSGGNQTVNLQFP